MIPGRTGDTFSKNGPFFSPEVKGLLALAVLATTVALGFHWWKASHPRLPRAGTAPPLPARPVEQIRYRSSEPAPRALPGPREPSGAVALPSLGGLLVVDDEPSNGGSEGLFFLEAKGGVLTEVPVSLPAGQGAFGSDWEGVTLAGNDVVLLASHSHDQEKRTRVCRIPVDQLRRVGSRMELRSAPRCAGARAQRAEIVRLVERAAVRGGYELPDHLAARKPKKGGLNLEGIVWSPTRKLFHVGLRSPLAERNGRGYAILLAMRWTGARPTFEVAAFVDLDDRGVRDLTLTPAGKILVSAGPAGKRGPFDLYELDETPGASLGFAAPRRITARAIPAGFKPEGLAILGSTLYLLSDEGVWPGTPARYAAWPWRPSASP